MKALRVKSDFRGLKFECNEIKLEHFRIKFRFSCETFLDQSQNLIRLKLSCVGVKVSYGTKKGISWD